MENDETHTDSGIIRQLRGLAKEIAPRSHSPYSNRDEAAVALLSNGSWIPGVRVESASFSLTIPAILNAVTTAVAHGRLDVVAIVTSRPLLPEEIVYVPTTPFERLTPVGPDAFALLNRTLPTPGDPMDTTITVTTPRRPHDGIAAARSAARNAHVPESNYAVGCVAEVEGGSFIPGANVENSDWNRILCAERNALGTAVSYGLHPIKALYLSCPSDATVTPCGACRQLLAELATRSVLWMDRGVGAPESTDPATLLPGRFIASSFPKPAG